MDHDPASIRSRFQIVHIDGNLKTPAVPATLLDGEPAYGFGAGRRGDLETGIVASDVQDLFLRLGGLFLDHPV